MSHAFSGLFGGGRKAAQPLVINIPPTPAPTVQQALTPVTQPLAPAPASRPGAETPSFLGGAALPPPPTLGGGQTQGKALLGS